MQVYTDKTFYARYIDNSNVSRVLTSTLLIIRRTSQQYY